MFMVVLYAGMKIMLAILCAYVTVYAYSRMMYVYLMLSLC